MYSSSFSAYCTDDRVLYFVGVVYLTPFRLNMFILIIFSMTSSVRSMEKPNSNVHVRVSSWTYKYWHLTGYQTLAEEVFSRQKRSGEKIANPRVPLFLQFPITQVLFMFEVVPFCVFM